MGMIELFGKEVPPGKRGKNLIVHLKCKGRKLLILRASYF